MRGRGEEEEEEEEEEEGFVQKEKRLVGKRGRKKSSPLSLPPSLLPLQSRSVTDFHQST